MIWGYPYFWKHLYKDLVHHPIETSIYKWLALGFQGGTLTFPCSYFVLVGSFWPASSSPKGSSMICANSWNVFRPEKMRDLATWDGAFREMGVVCSKALTQWNIIFVPKSQHAFSEFRKISWKGFPFKRNIRCMSEKSETTLKFSAPGSLLTPPGTCESAVERWNPSVGLRLGGDARDGSGWINGLFHLLIL